MSKVINSDVAGDAQQVGNTQNASDSHYSQKLRDGFIALRNTYATPNTRTQPTIIKPHNKGDKPSSSRSRDNRYRGAHSYKERRHPGTRRILSDQKNLYKSNSSLELDHIDYTEERKHPLRRDFGSTSSLDVMSAGGNSFFALLQDYHNENVDQRAPAPPQMREVLRGQNVGYTHQHNPMSVSNSQMNMLSVSSPTTMKISVNGALQPQDDLDSPDTPNSPKLRSKSVKGKDRKIKAKTTLGEPGSSSSNTGGIFRKLRGTKPGEIADVSKSPENSSEGDIRGEDRQKRKALVHFDCQSIGVNLLDVIRRRNASDDSSLKRRNTTTGASAASGVRSLANNNHSASKAESEDSDLGDGKSNDLVLSCPFFRNEIGGEEERYVCLNRVTAQKRAQELLGNKYLNNQQLHKPPACNGVAILDISQNPKGVRENPLCVNNGYIVEYVDYGAHFYRNFFHNFDHQNFFGIDDNLGPVAVTIRREKLDEKERDLPTGREEAAGSLYQYRIIIRTSELTVLRCSILEEFVTSSSRLSNTRGLPPREVLEQTVPDLNIACLKQAIVGPKTAEALLKLDEQGVTMAYKIGILHCKAGQSTEEEMYNNEYSEPAFEEFLQILGKKVRLKGFEGYRGGLDCKTDSTGTESIFAKIGDYEIMFHVASMLPFTPNNKQQLLRKRHIGNDIVTVIFQEPGALPFTAKSVRSQFQHVFIVVRVLNPNTENVAYSVSVTRSKEVPPFGPRILDGAMFGKTSGFVDFLLTKAINAENAVHRSDKFIAMASRTRQEYLKDLATNFVTTVSLDSSSKLSKFSLGSGRRKEKPKVRTMPDMFAKGALVWNVQLEDFSQSQQIECLLGLGAEVIVLIEESSKDVVFTTSCHSIIGWTSQGSSLRVYYDHGECVEVKSLSADEDEINEIINRLQMITDGSETMEMTLRRNSLGQLGFHVHYEGIVSDVEPTGFAFQKGLRAGSRLVEICKVAVATLTHEQMVDLLRTSVQVKVVVVPPNEDGTPRRCRENVWSSHSALNYQHTAFSADPPPLSEIFPAHLQSSQKSNRVDVDPPQRPPPPANYTQSDMRSVYINLESKFKQAHNLSHSKQSPQDGNATRTALPILGLSSDAGAPGLEERDHRYRTDDKNRHPDVHAEHGPGWAGKVTIYPAYSRNPHQATSPPVSPQAPPNSGQSQHWYEQTNTSRSADFDQRGSDHHLNRPATSKAPFHGSASQPAFTIPTSQTAFVQSTSQRSLDNQIHTHQVHGYMVHEGREREGLPDRSPGSGSADANLSGTPPGAANLNITLLSDTISSHSSGGSSRHDRTESDIHTDITSSRNDRTEASAHTHHKADEVISARIAKSHRKEHGSADENDHKKDARSNRSTKENKKSSALSPAGHRRHTVVGTRRGQNVDMSPHSSASSSPRNSNRNLTGVASEENLSGRLRSGSNPGVHQINNVEHAVASGKSSRDHKSGTRNLAEDLKRLINPDVSFTDSDTSPDKERLPSVKNSRRKRGRSPRIHRTLSDESMCGTINKSRTASKGSDRDLNPEPRLTPRATGQSHTSSNPALPLLDPSSGINWNNLVDAANKAFQQGELPSKLSAIEGLERLTPESQDTSTQRYKSSLSSSAAKTPESSSTASTPAKGSTLATPTQERVALVGQGAMPNLHWRGAEGTNQDQDLETRVKQLEMELHMERQDKAALEEEMQDLRQENARLQDESQRAAAQLRKFTEWFFNTMDKH